MLFLNYESRKKRLLIFMCVLFLFPGCRNREEGNPVKDCPCFFKIMGYGKSIQWIELM